VYERIILDELKRFDDTLQSSQGGFRPRRSTYDQITLLEEVCRAYPKAYHAFLDIKAAYDCVDRRILWKRISDKTGIQQEYIEILRELFDKNKSYLVINGKESKAIKNRSGLLQGSSLSPILFIYFVDDLVEHLNNSGISLTLFGHPINNLFFADDGALHALTADNLRILLRIAEDWGELNGIEFAPLKSAIFSEDPTETFTLYGAEIPLVEAFKYLGIYFSRQGIDWALSTEPRIQKTKKLIKWMQSKGMYMYGWRQYSSVVIYKCFFFLRPCLEYGFAMFTEFIVIHNVQYN
jgi:hypothetical protein